MPLVLFRKTEDDKFKYLSSLFEEVYFKDIIERYQIGLRNVRLNLRRQEETHIMENIMYNELVCRGYSVDVGVVDIFETGAEGKRKKISCEIDFVVNKGRKKYYIQSVLSLGDARKEKTELWPLLGIRYFFRKIIVTKSGMKPWIDEEGILRFRKSTDTKQVFLRQPLAKQKLECYNSSNRINRGACVTG